ncbi:MAG: hypothetical protein WBV82_04150 [Myxococcaceae bacterium]
MDRLASRFFGGAELQKLVIRYQFQALRFARAEGDRLVFGTLGYPEMLGRKAPATAWFEA